MAYHEDNGNLSFHEISGKKILEENEEHPRKFFSTRLNGHILHGTEAAFQSPDGEVIGGLGQHNDGVMNFRGHFVHMSQYNTVIPIPMLVSNLGYGILWDNPSLTELNPQKEEIPLCFEPDIKTGMGLLLPVRMESIILYSKSKTGICSVSIYRYILGIISSLKEIRTGTPIFCQGLYI